MRAAAPSSPRRSVARHVRTPEAHAPFTALADRARVRIVNLLVAGELYVCDLVELLDLPQPSVSRHLAILRASGLVRVARRGRFAHYRLADPKTSIEHSILACVCDDLTAPPLAAERSRAAGRVAQRREAPC